MADMNSDDRPVPVAPDSVRVWRGFRLNSLNQDVFFEKLGSIFIPATVQIQAPVGLTAYLPSVLPAEKPEGAPDEIALVFYAYQKAYDEAKETVGGRAYSDLHGLVFDLSRSTSGFPVKFEGRLEADMRYHLFDQHIDWQEGVVHTYVGMRRQGSGESFLSAVADWLSEVQGGDQKPDGAVAVAAEHYVTYWEHWPDPQSAEHSRIPALAQWTRQAYRTTFPSNDLNEGLWQPYSGVKVEGGESFNFRFRRRKSD